MKVLEAHLARRSIRKYKPDPVPPETIKHLLAAAFAAPSAVNSRPWHLIVVDDRERCRRLGGLHDSLSPAKRAPLVFVVCGDPRIGKRWIEDTSAMTENILNQCVEEGLGACWLAVRDKCEDEVREILGIPEGIRVLCLISIGYPDEEKEPRTQFEAKKAHHNSWGNELPEGMRPSS
ncbi:MAG: nitroreductase family protein [candidate division WOR-3 bacterium]